ncbi:ABC transporter substrate-binding protein [Arsenicitalea aurantiaca]|uniref:ABC transporter substrate-binding protein n=1 Tax=Arsenicitalea aurantiaca TaxID=1783274 RepID=A0A433XEI5_9HYPH|nr:ABC transporter substrate-binding protein [Arsenicitalea aurantiaca]RUT32476.1 ABC transporter substrate-binding protein [Arsenicitalea aurantiaca]
MRSFRTYVSLIPLALAGVLLPGAAFAQPSGVLVIAENETPENLDPANATNSTVNQLLIGAYDTLVQFTAGETQVSPRIATAWEISEDGLAYTFTLREDVTFHDGTPLTAEDVKFTLDRLQAASANVLNDMGPFAGAEVVDEKTVVLRLSEPFGPFISALSRIYIVNKALVEPHMGEDNARQFLAVNGAGSGPYQITGYSPTEAVTLRAFPDYWGGWDGSHVEEVVFRYVSEPSTQLSLLQRGEVHIAPDLTVEDKLALMDTPGFKVDIGAAATPLFFAFNTAGEGPTSDPEFRRMLAMTFDRELHLEQVLMGFGNLPDGPLPVGWLGHEPGTEAEFDLEAARALVDENGWAGTNLLVRYLPAIQEEQRAVEQLQSNLSQIGINLQAEGMTWPAQAATVTSIETTSDINMLYNFPSFPDPHAVLNTTFNSALSGANGGYNWSQYSNPEVDELLNAAATSSDPEERAELYRQVQRLVGEDHVVITVSNPGSVVAMAENVSGYVYNAAHHQTFNYMDISLD